MVFSFQSTALSNNEKTVKEIDKTYKKILLKYITLSNMNTGCALHGFYAGYLNESSSDYIESMKAGEASIDAAKENLKEYIRALKKAGNNEMKIKRLQNSLDHTKIETIKKGLTNLYKKEGPQGLFKTLREMFDAEENDVLPIWLNTCVDAVKYTNFILSTEK